MERSRVLQSLPGKPKEGDQKFIAVPGAARRLQDTGIDEVTVLEEKLKAARVQKK